ncbi:MAG: adenosine deaminase, partial [Gammaproteobacteria bacterium]|nr:adenosine deaminase [Gammaproteobacteria bacterium]
MSNPDDRWYGAFVAHDARFDGRVFVGVTSTGIYCRPVCRVRTPRRANCRFFAHAAAAESAGFRPCLRCRPE